VNAVDPNARDTYVQQWNLAVQKRIGDGAFEVAYVANKANKIFTSENLNVPGDFNSLYVLGTAALIRPGFSSISWRQADVPANITAADSLRTPRIRADLFFVHLGHGITTPSRSARGGRSGVPFLSPQAG
jgi:hypothetical protein